MRINSENWFSTYSIVALDQETGQLGVAVQTHQMGVGSLVPWLLPGIGALATQSFPNFSFGPIGLRMLGEGIPAPQVIAGLVASDPEAAKRQVAVVDAAGQVGAWTGENCIPEAGHHLGEAYSVQANMMAEPKVIAAMAAAYEGSGVDFAGRLLASLVAAQAEGGDIRGEQSAAIKIVPGVSGDKKPATWETLYDLRVDEHDNPVKELGRLVRLRRAQLHNGTGYEALDKGELAKALQIWAEARDQAPELEEMSFWQAVTLADEHDNLPEALVILKPMLAKDPRRSFWIDLIRRLQVCGIMERDATSDELLAGLGVGSPDE
jgi:uncharacterized Ntn-hydrolase superfamily protein